MEQKHSSQFLMNFPENKKMMMGQSKEVEQMKKFTDSHNILFKKSPTNWLHRHH